MLNLRSSHDMATWLNLLRNGGYAYGLNQNLAKYRIVANSNTKNKIKAAYDVWKVYRDHEQLNLLFSLFNFIFYAKNAFIKRLF